MFFFRNNGELNYQSHLEFAHILVKNDIEKGPLHISSPFTNKTNGFLLTYSLKNSVF